MKLRDIWIGGIPYVLYLNKRGKGFALHKEGLEYKRSKWLLDILL